jgi:uncharacterized membrane protein
MGAAAEAARLGTAVRARAFELAAGALTVTGAVLLAATSIFRHDHFGSNAYDLGIFDQTVWGYSRLEILPNTVLRLPTALGDHFHPILMALAPLYWVWDDARVLLLAQAALLALASVPVFLWARERLGSSAALLFQASYLVFWAVLGGALFDFHELAVAAPIVSVALYALLTRNDTLLLVAAALGLLTREDIALTFVGVGLFAAFVQRRWKLGAALAAVSFAWFAIAFKVVIPALADRAYSHWAYSGLGPDPARAALHLVLHPIDSAREFFTPRDKLVALFNLFVPWALLPLVSPLLLVMLPTLAARFFSDKPSHWAPQGFHYSLVLAPMLAFAAVDTAARIDELLGRRALRRFGVGAGMVVLVLGIYFSFARLKPLDELRRYTGDEQIAAIEACLSDVPPRASVAATSALVPHLTHRRRVYVLDRRPIPDVDVYALDLSTWTFPFTVDDARALVSRAQADGYGTRCSREFTVVLARGGSTMRLSPELQRLLGQRAQRAEARLGAREVPAVDGHNAPAHEVLVHRVANAAGELVG